MDFLSEQALLYTSKKYEPIYIHLNSKYDIKYQDIFLLCASLGFKKNREQTVEDRGRELRTNFFKTDQKAAIYSIILSDQEIGRDIEEFEKPEFRLRSRKKLERYAEGGMSVLVEEVFGIRWDGHKLDESYKEYEVDIVSYLYTDLNEVPF